MLCDLCQRDEAMPGKPLCQVCAEGVFRAINLKLAEAAFVTIKDPAEAQRFANANYYDVMRAG